MLTPVGETKCERVPSGSVSGADGDADTEGDGEGGDDGPPHGSTLPWLAETPPGTSLLVAGPPMTRKRRLTMRLLAGIDAAAARVLVTTRADADGIEREYRSVDPRIVPERLAVVDCVTEQRGSGFDPGRERTATRRYANDPGDLTGVGIGVSEFMRRFADEGTEVAVGLHTLSTMLMYADLNRLYRFVHVLTSRANVAGARGAYVLDDAADDPGVIAQPFDGMVAVRDGESGPEVRVRGVDPGPRRWTPLQSL